MIEIRDLCAAERGQATSLWHECDLTVPWNDPGDDFDRAVLNETSKVLGGFKDNVLVATAMVGYEGHRGWVYYVGVRPHLRQNGIAKMMMKAAEDWLRGLGAPKVMLMVRAGNQAAETLYESLGYEVSPVKTYGKFFD